MTAQLYPTDFEMLENALDLSTRIKYLGLYQNPLALTKGFNPLAIVECDFTGYAHIDISGGWVAPVIDINGNGMSANILYTFTKAGATANAAVYGLLYFAVDGVTILFAQEFSDGPYPMTTDGDIIRITPQIVSSGPALP